MEFAKEQLIVSIDFESPHYDPEETYTLNSPEEWRKGEIEDATACIERSESNIAEEKKKSSQAIKIYKKYLQYVERLDNIYGEKLKEF